MAYKANSKYYRQLTFKAGQFIKYIAQRSIYGKIAYISDYMIKIQIIKHYESYGFFVIYYKPTKKQYSIATKEISNSAMKEYLQELWDNMNSELVRGETNSDKYFIKVNLP